MKITEIKTKKRFRKDLGDLTSLKESIKEIGLLQPIVVDENNILIAGERRLRACEELGIKDIKVNKVNIKDSLKGEFDENVIRKEFNPSESVAIWEAMEKKTGNQYSLPCESHQSTPKEKASKTLGIGTQKLSQAKQVIEFGNKELIEEMDKTGNVNKAYKEVKREIAKKEKKEIPLPDGEYNVIYVDPPWKYNDECNEGSIQSGGAKKHYSLMSIKELCGLDVPASKNAVMFMWVTSPLLEECFEVINAWGFKYKTSFIWDKVKHNMGHYNSVRHELLLICTKGSFTPEVKKLFDSVYVEERTKHSKKPDWFYKMIETLYPNGKYLEMFARQKYNDKWTVWGNEI